MLIDPIWPNTPYLPYLQLNIAASNNEYIWLPWKTYSPFTAQSPLWNKSAFHGIYLLLKAQTALHVSASHCTKCLLQHISASPSTYSAFTAYPLFCQIAGSNNDRIIKSLYWQVHILFEKWHELRDTSNIDGNTKSWWWQIHMLPK